MHCSVPGFREITHYSPWQNQNSDYSIKMWFHYCSCTNIAFTCVFAMERWTGAVQLVHLQYVKNCFMYICIYMLHRTCVCIMKKSPMNNFIWSSQIHFNVFAFSISTVSDWKVLQIHIANANANINEINCVHSSSERFFAAVANAIETQTH